jgi:hypothetical protein
VWSNSTNGTTVEAEWRDHAVRFADGLAPQVSLLVRREPMPVSPFQQFDDPESANTTTVPSTTDD